MDIAKFNQELAKRVSKAKNYQRLDKIQEAIDMWVNVAELVLRASKTPNLPFSYKSMLIKKSEDIMKHVKILKSRISPKQEILEKQSKTPPTSPPKIKKSIKDEESKVHEKKQVIKKSLKSPKNIPKGFKEIQASKDFKIITPHDEKYLDKLLSMNYDLKTSEKNQESEKIDIPSRNEGKEFCFACGAELLPNQRQCPQCGTNLK